MFIRESQTKSRQTGAVYKSYKLVESYCGESGPRQRVVLSLSSLILPKSQWRKLAAALEMRLSGKVSLFEEEPHIAAAAEAAMQSFDFHQLRTQEMDEREEGRVWTAVDLESIETIDSRSLGPELVIVDPRIRTTERGSRKLQLEVR